MSKISEIKEQIEFQKDLLVKTKLEEIIPILKSGEEMDYVEEFDYKFSYDEVTRLIRLLNRYGYDGKNFIYGFVEGHEWGGNIEQQIIVKINGELLSIVGGEKKPDCIPRIIYEVTENDIKYGANKEEIIKIIEGLTDIDFNKSNIEKEIEEMEKQKIKSESQSLTTEDEKMLLAKEELKHFAYNLELHEVVDTREKDVEIDDIYISSLSWVIGLILKNKIVDTRSNAYFGEDSNTCEIGRYDDMPGEEEIANILNSVDRSLLAIYFIAYPNELTLFEEMRSKHSDVLPLDLKNISNEIEEIDGVKIVHTGLKDETDMEIIEIYDENGNRWYTNCPSIEGAQKIVERLKADGKEAVIGPKAPGRMEDGTLVRNPMEGVVGVYIVKTIEEKEVALKEASVLESLKARKMELAEKSKELEEKTKEAKELLGSYEKLSNDKNNTEPDFKDE